MTSMAFDTLRYNRRLLEAGVPEPQAEVQAELMAEAFGFYAANLLTKDHFTEVLNARFSEFGALQDLRFAEQDAKFDKRYLEQDAKFDKRFAAIDQRFLEQDAKFDKRFAAIDQRFLEQDAKSDKRFAEQDVKWELRFAQMNRTLFLHTWMLGLLVVAIVVPQLQVWFA